MKTERSISSVLLHPVWLVSLAVLVVNDHMLKGSGLVPGWLTGKLSDLAGMFVAPPLFALLVRAKDKRGLALSHATVGVVYAILEISPYLTGRLDALYQVFGHHYTATSDLTDLIALALLPISYWWCERASRAAARTSGSRYVLHKAGVAGAGMLACVATSDTVPDPADCDYDCDMDGYEAPEDCNDFDSSVNPALGNCPGSDMNESCNNGVDDNQDGLTDCEDPKCATACTDTFTVCATPPALTVSSGPVAGSTLIGTWALEGSCGGADAPENIYNVSSAVSGMLSFPVPEGHVAYTRALCSDGFGDDRCVVGPLDDAPADEFSVHLDSGVPRTLVIDAIDALSASEYQLDLRFVPDSCGDGFVDAPEECDDGNLVDGDECASDCTVATDKVCATIVPLELSPMTTTFENGTYAAQSPCGEGALNTPERGFSFTAIEAGTLTVSAQVEGKAVSVFAETECLGTVIDCSPPVEPGPTVLGIPLGAGDGTVVFVEGPGGLDTASTLEVSATFTPN